MTDSLVTRGCWRHRLISGVCLFMNWTFICWLLLAPHSVAIAQPLPQTLEQSYLDLARESNEISRFYSLIKRVVAVTRPSVAHIEARKTKVSANGSSSQTRKAFVEEAGSGVIIQHRNRFFAITNFHVIDGAEVSDISVTVNGRTYRPTDVRHDRESDLSVLLLDATDLKPAHLGNSDQIDIGEMVLAIGSPFGLDHSVSQGIISAKHRRDLDLGPRGVKYQDFFQTDAAINPGNSGGPLLNMRGEVIAVNTAIASNSGGSDGIGFSIPINMAMRICTDLIDHGTVQRGFLGVSMDGAFTPQQAFARGLDFNHGALISEVTPGSPAAEAKLQVGDIILNFNERPVGNDSHLVTLVSLVRLGEQVPMEIYRDGQHIAMQVTIRGKENTKRDTALPAVGVNR